MKNETFDPTIAPTLKITACKNGWAVSYQRNHFEEGICAAYPDYVFNSPAELADAVANLVQFGSIEKPSEPEANPFSSAAPVETDVLF